MGLWAPKFGSLGPELGISRILEYSGFRFGIWGIGLLFRLGRAVVGGWGEGLYGPRSVEFWDIGTRVGFAAEALKCCLLEFTVWIRDS